MTWVLHSWRTAHSWCIVPIRFELLEVSKCVNTDPCTYFSRSPSPKTRVNPILQVSRIASRGNTLPWTIRISDCSKQRCRCLRPRKDWTAINRSRPADRKKVDQKTRKYFPLTDSVIENHLLGKETIGVFPLSSDETCWFLAVDFDKTRDFRSCNPLTLDQLTAV
jgi:hypothetical protein